MTPKLTALPGGGPPVLPEARSPLRPSAALDLDQAELFLLELDQRADGANLGRAMYLLGLAEGHLSNMIELVRAVTR